jgi:hypothetical protein
MGLNYPIRPTPRTPIELHVGDFDQDGDVETVPAYWDDGRLYPWLDLADAIRQLPALAARYPTNHAFASATLDDLVGPRDPAAGNRLAAGTFATTVLENRGAEAFRARDLPLPAQVSPVRAIVIADFDGNGSLDLVVAGNLYELEARVPRADAGVGLFLRGDGAGGFVAVNTPVSGLLLDGRVARLVRVRSGSGSPDVLAGVAGGAVRYIRTAGSAIRPDARDE